jgi:hypothetical protein
MSDYISAPTGFQQLGMDRFGTNCRHTRSGSR